MADGASVEAEGLSVSSTASFHVVVGRAKVDIAVPPQGHLTTNAERRYPVMETDTISALIRGADRMQRETYERAGRDARRMGVQRAANPFLCTRDNVSACAQDRIRQKALAAYWWAGWDAGSPVPTPRGRPVRSAA